MGKKVQKATAQTPIERFKKMFDEIVEISYLEENTIHRFSGWKFYSGGNGYFSVEDEKSKTNSVEAVLVNGKIQFSRFPIVLMHTFDAEGYIEDFMKSFKEFIESNSKNFIEDIEKQKDTHEKAIKDLDEKKSRISKKK